MTVVSHSAPVSILVRVQNYHLRFRLSYTLESQLISNLYALHIRPISFLQYRTISPIELHLRFTTLCHREVHINPPSLFLSHQALGFSFCTTNAPFELLSPSDQARPHDQIRVYGYCAV